MAQLRVHRLIRSTHRLSVLARVGKCDVQLVVPHRLLDGLDLQHRSLPHRTVLMVRGPWIFRPVDQRLPVGRPDPQRLTLGRHAPVHLPRVAHTLVKFSLGIYFLEW